MYSSDSEGEYHNDVPDSEDDNCGSKHKSTANPRQNVYFQEPSCYVFDTNEFVESDVHRSLEELSKAHLVVIPKVVTEELSELRGNTSATPAQITRAKQSLETIENLVKARTGQKDAGRGLFIQNSIEKDKNVSSVLRLNDDKILACVCYFARRGPTKETYLVTDDKVLSLKAFAEGVKVKKSI